MHAESGRISRVHAQRPDIPLLSILMAWVDGERGPGCHSMEGTPPPQNPDSCACPTPRATHLPCRTRRSAGGGDCLHDRTVSPASLPVRLQSLSHCHLSTCLSLLKQKHACQAIDIMQQCAVSTQCAIHSSTPYQLQERHSP